VAICSSSSTKRMFLSVMSPGPQVRCEASRWNPTPSIQHVDGDVRDLNLLSINLFNRARILKLQRFNDTCIYNCSRAPFSGPFSKTSTLPIPNTNKRNYERRYGLGSSLGRLGQRKNLDTREIPDFNYSEFHPGFPQVVLEL